MKIDVKDEHGPYFVSFQYDDSLKKIGCSIKIGDREHSRVIAEGSTRCGPDDNYNHRIGRHIALGRALKQLGLLNEVRRLFVKQVYSQMRPPIGISRVLPEKTPEAEETPDDRIELRSVHIE